MDTRPILSYQVSPKAETGVIYDEVKKDEIIKSDFSPNTVIDSDYVVADKLGSGGMASVYHVFSDLGSHVIKLYHTSEDEPTREWLWDKFLTEACIHHQLDHRLIPSYQDIGAHEGAWYIKMQRVLGDPLSLLIEENQVSAIQAARYCRDIADALYHLHGKGYIHRDIKPDNILITPYDEAVLLDFSLTVPIEYYDGNHVEEIIEGTPGYFSPEQIKGRPLDFRSDLYSLGKTFYACLEGKDQDPGNLIKELGFKPKDVCCFPDRDITPDWDHVMKTLLAPDREQRYTSAKDVIRDLEGLVTVAAAPKKGWFGF